MGREEVFNQVDHYLFIYRSELPHFKIRERFPVFPPPLSKKKKNQNKCERYWAGRGRKEKKEREKDRKILHKSPESVSSAFKIIKAPLK